MEIASCSILSASDAFPFILEERADRSFLEVPSGSSEMCKSAISTSPLSNAKCTADSLMDESSVRLTALSRSIAAAELSWSEISWMLSEIHIASDSSPLSILWWASKRLARGPSTVAHLSAAAEWSSAASSSDHVALLTFRTK